MDYRENGALWLIGEEIWEKMEGDWF